MPVGTSAADNFDAGGIAAPIDVETGRLGRAVRKRGTASLVAVDAHPDTGAVIAGRELPQWRTVRAVTCRAHALLPSLGFVGWDVAITPDGPVLVEGNQSPCCMLSQMPSRDPLGTTAYIQRILEIGAPT